MPAGKNFVGLFWGIIIGFTQNFNWASAVWILTDTASRIYILCLLLFIKCPACRRGEIFWTLYLDSHIILTAYDKPYALKAPTSQGLSLESHKGTVSGRSYFFLIINRIFYPPPLKKKKNGYVFGAFFHEFLRGFLQTNYQGYSRDLSLYLKPNSWHKVQKTYPSITQARGLCQINILTWAP